jgi:hypothetical protein
MKMNVAINPLGVNEMPRKSLILLIYCARADAKFSFAKTDSRSAEDLTWL